MPRQTQDPRRSRHPSEARDDGRHHLGGARGRMHAGADGGSTMMHLRPEDFGEDFPHQESGSQDLRSARAYSAEDDTEGYGGGRGRLLSGAERGQTPRYQDPDTFNRHRRPLHQGGSWDEDRYGYPEATSYAREMRRGRDSYEPEGRFARDDDRGGDPYNQDQAWRRGGSAQYGYGGVIDESDYRRYGGEGGRGSGGGYGGPGGYGAMGGYGAEGLWRGDASQGGRGGNSGNPWSTRRGRYAAQGPKGYSRSDDRIKEDVCERLHHADDVDVSNVSVQVSGGNVQLEGTVPDRWMKYRIEDLCDACSGVTDVENRIRISRGEARSQDPTQSFEQQASADRKPQPPRH